MTSQQQRWSPIAQCEFQQLGSSNGLAGALAKFGSKSTVAIPLAVHLYANAMYADGCTIYNYNISGLAKHKGRAWVKFVIKHKSSYKNFPFEGRGEDV